MAAGCRSSRPRRGARHLSCLGLSQRTDAVRAPPAVTEHRPEEPRSLAFRVFRCCSRKHIISYPILARREAKNILSYPILSYPILSYHTISYHIISYHIISYHIISYHIISYHIISYHIISYHIISYHIISYHIIYIYIYVYMYICPLPLYHLIGQGRQSLFLHHRSPASEPLSLAHDFWTRLDLSEGHGTTEDPEAVAELELAPKGWARRAT